MSDDETPAFDDPRDLLGLARALDELAGASPEIASAAREVARGLRRMAEGGEGSGDEPESLEALISGLLDGSSSEERVLEGLRRLSRTGEWTVEALGSELIERARAELPGWPERSGRVAEVARLLADGTRSPEGRTLAVHARIFLANARRAALDLEGAEELLVEVEKLAMGFVLPWLVEGDRCFVEYALRQDLRQLEEALHWAQEAAFAFEQAGRRDLRLRAVLATAIVRRRLGDFRAAAAAAQQVVQEVDEEDDRNLAFAARGNFAIFLCDIGEFGPARGRLIRDRALWDSFENPAIQMRRRWLEGRIAAGFGEAEEALVALREAFAGFRDLGLVLDAVLVSLDLAANLLDQERGGELVAHGEEVRAMGEGASEVLERTGEDLRGAIEEYGTILVEGRFTFGTYWAMQERFAGPRKVGGEGS